MIDFVEFIKNFAGEESLKEVLEFNNWNKKELQEAYEQAWQKTIDWYENEYGDKYGAKK